MQHYGKALGAAVHEDEHVAGPSDPSIDQAKPPASLTGALIESGRQAVTVRSKSSPKPPPPSPRAQRSQPAEKSPPAVRNSTAEGPAESYHRVLAERHADQVNGSSQLSVDRLSWPRMRLPTLKDLGFVVIGYLLFLIALLVVFQLLPFA